jgi:spore maturation protein CgeB
VGSSWKSNPHVRGAKIISDVSYIWLNKLYNMAKICINVHRDSFRKCYATLNPRTFEVLGAGQMLISDEVLGINDFLNPVTK